jgi:hypothetical protein
MVEAIVMMNYPAGSLPARGFRCEVCGNETLLLQDAQAVNDLAKRLGMFGLEDARSRKLQRTGTSLCVTLDPELLRKTFPRAKRGSVVRVGSQGSRIIIEEA